MPEKKIIYQKPDYKMVWEGGKFSINMVLYNFEIQNGKINLA
jgi:hypothetical protein